MEEIEMHGSKNYPWRKDEGLFDGLVDYLFECFGLNGQKTKFWIMMAFNLGMMITWVYCQMAIHVAYPP